MNSLSIIFIFISLTSVYNCNTKRNLQADHQIIQIDKLMQMAKNNFPIPSVTPTGLTRLDHSEVAKCTEDSVIQNPTKIADNYKPYITCNGKTAYIMPWAYNVTLDNKIELLLIPNGTFLASWVNGNVLFTANGLISSPPKCEADYYREVSFFAAKTHFECLTTGLSELHSVYTLKQITGKCISTCWNLSGHTNYGPPLVNNLGSVIKP